jgi:Fic family protein
MTYKTLQKEFDEDASNTRFERNRAEAQRRREDISAFNSKIMLETGEMFFAAPKELIVLTEKVLRLERKVSQLWRDVPHIVKRSYFYDLITTEIISSNQIEGVRSTRKQIKDALDSISAKEPHAKDKKFIEFANLYCNITEPNSTFPQNAQDIRLIFDSVVAGNLREKDRPDGELFRAQSVEIFAGQTRLIHTGVMPEGKITEMITAMIELVRSEEIPALYSAILSHFLFEYIHPFYDGNGRTGRYLLSLYLSEPLSVATVLSLSKTIAENLSDYYKAFTEVEADKNHADATPFLLTLLGMIRKAQDSLLEELQQKSEALNSGHDGIAQLALGNEKLNEILFCLLHYELFALSKETDLPVVESYIQRGYETTRKYLTKLEEMGLVEPTTKRPLRFALSGKALSLLNTQNQPQVNATS